MWLMQFMVFEYHLRMEKLKKPKGLFGLIFNDIPGGEWMQSIHPIIKGVYYSFYDRLYSPIC